ncbi:hypothetical protein QA600_20090 [Natronococcus sp. A-GB1]|uniref:hypothetical protein n=1 Tax=Natronococcus sp. A-GB1 TaxID=3037648 RepID=UPI00241F829A|nr:hypothetical protein [Natronococcus sp. A-GB1]MDG5761631.1 hypothetical protein [Natronococcus sp. A-GB1]
MADDLSDGARTSLRKHPLIKYGISVVLLAVIVAEIGLDASTWLSAQLVAGLLGSAVVVGILWLAVERTALGRSADQAFRRHHLPGALVIVVVVSVGGIAVSSVLEEIPRLFALAVTLGLFGGAVILEGVTDYRQ